MVCIAAANAGATSQDLKTGLPRRRHAARAADRPRDRRGRRGARHRRHRPGARHPTAGSSPGIRHAIGSEKFPAPQATLMATLIKGLLAFNLDWQFVLVGVFAGRDDGALRRRLAVLRGRRLPAALHHLADLRRRPGPGPRGSGRAQAGRATWPPARASSAREISSRPASSPAARSPAWPSRWRRSPTAGRASSTRCRSRAASVRTLGAGGYQLLGLGCFAAMAATLWRVAHRRVDGSK